MAFNTFIFRYSNLRFVNPSQLTAYKGEPLSPTEMQKRVFEQCDDARNILRKVRLRGQVTESNSSIELLFFPLCRSGFLRWLWCL